MNQLKLRIGIAGLGRLGQRHAQNLSQRVPNAEVVAACSPIANELEWARTTLGIQHGYNDYAALLAHPGLDAVFLVTPTSMHAEQIIQALQANVMLSFDPSGPNQDGRNATKSLETRARMSAWLR